MHISKVCQILALVICFGHQAFGLDTLNPTTSFQEATLSQLLPGNSLSPADGSFVFDNFTVSGTSVPELNSLRIAAGSDGTSGWLTFTLPVDHRVITGLEVIDLDVAFSARHIDPLSVLSDIALDAEGATFGTTGSGMVEVTSLILEGNTSLAAITVGDYAGAVDKLFESTSVNGLNHWDVKMAIAASPGTDMESAAVLSDFQVSFMTVQVPEPSSISVLGGLGITWIVIMSRISRRGFGIE